MKQKMYLSNREYDVMKVFWMEGKGLRKADFLWQSEESWIGPKAIQKVLDGLSDKGLIKVTDEDALFGKIYKTAVSYAEWLRNSLCEILSESSEEEAMCCMLEAFAEQDGKISDGMVNTMKNYLEALEA